MATFLHDTMLGLISGQSYATSEACFNLAFLMFILATLGYMVFLVSRKDLPWKIGFVTSAAAALLLTVALILRWIAAGWAHPPFTNLYESMVFFAWGIVIYYLYLEKRHQIKVAGAFIIPLACITMGLASMSPNKEIEPLVPALQSIWLHLHVMVASVGYAAFVAAFAFALLYFLKDRLPLQWFVGALSLFAVFAIPAASKGSVWQGIYKVDQMVQHAGEWVKVPLSGMGSTMQFKQVVLPGVGPIFLLAWLGFAACFALAFYHLRRDPEGPAEKTYLLFHVVFAVLTLGLAWLLVQFGRFPEARLAGNPYSFALLFVLWLSGLMVVASIVRYDTIVEALPDVKVLDQLTYNVIMVGFPLMTLVIVTGAIWANKAWGRYWGWDPKETASLVTWLIYLLYLHTRFTQGWRGRRGMFIAVLGFISVVFTYLGVNLLLSGLHAYATG